MRKFLNFQGLNNIIFRILPSHNEHLQKITDGGTLKNKEKHWSTCQPNPVVT